MLQELQEEERAFLTLSITDIVSIFSITKIIQEMAAESTVDRGESGLGQVLKYLGYRKDLGEEYFQLMSKEYPPDVPVTAYDIMYVRAKVMCRAYTCLGALVYDIYLMLSHYKYAASLFNLPLDILPRIVTLFCKGIGSIPVVAQVLRLYPHFIFTQEAFDKVASGMHTAFLARLRKGREEQSNLQLLKDYLDVRDAFDADLAALAPSLNQTVRFTQPIVPIEHHQVIIMLLQEFTAEQVDKFESFLMDEVGLELDKNGDLILNFAAIPVDKLQMTCEYIIEKATDEQKKITTHKVHLLKSLIMSLK